MKKMKFILGGILMYCSFSFGQTNVIALKSHAGNTSELLKEKDNFGEHPGMKLSNVDSVKFIPKEKIVIEYKTYGGKLHRDTTSYKLETDKALQNHLKAIRLNGWYPKRTKFIGFPEEIEQQLIKEKTVKQNAISFWFILSVLGLGGVLVKAKEENMGRG